MFKKKKNVSDDFTNMFPKDLIREYLNIFWTLQ